MAFLNLAASRPDRSELNRALRVAKAASFQHKKLTSSLQSASLDRIEQHVNDPRPEEIKRSVASLDHTMRSMLNDVVGNMR